ncbi:DUF1905 domain-containing protein [Pseudolactococcus yaeyamensis]
MDNNAAHVDISFDVKATFDGEPDEGGLVKMGTPCQVIGVRQSIPR